MKRNDSLLLAAIVAVAFLIRLTAIYATGPSGIRFGDAPDYLAAATGLCRTGSYPDRSSLPFFRAPGLPFFITATTVCHPGTIWFIKVALAGLDAFSVAILSLVAEELFGNREIGVLSACGAAI